MRVWRCAGVHSPPGPHAGPAAALPELVPLASELPPALVPVALMVVEFLGAFVPAPAAAAPLQLGDLEHALSERHPTGLLSSLAIPLLRTLLTEPGFESPASFLGLGLQVWWGGWAIFFYSSLALLTL